MFLKEIYIVKKLKDKDTPFQIFCSFLKHWETFSVHSPALARTYLWLKQQQSGLQKPDYKSLSLYESAKHNLLVRGRRSYTFPQDKAFQTRARLLLRHSAFRQVFPAFTNCRNDLISFMNSMFWWRSLQKKKNSKLFEAQR